MNYERKSNMMFATVDMSEQLSNNFLFHQSVSQ